MSRRSERTLIGWREWVLLPRLSTVPIKVKVDTGARTSTLHAFDLEVLERDGRPWAQFEVHPIQRSRLQATTVSHPVHSFKSIRSSTGHAQRRPVLRTPIRISGFQYDIDVTLTPRDEMGFRMLLGRAALHGRFLVDPGRSFLGAIPSEHPSPEGESIEP
jgi:hypothetical protein